MAESIWPQIGDTPNVLWSSPLVCPPRDKERRDLPVNSCRSLECVLARFAEGVYLPSAI